MARKPIIAKPQVPLQALEEAARAEPGDLDAQVRYGWALYGAGRLDEARKFLEAQRARHPQELEILYSLALTLKKAGESEEARKVFAEVKSAVGAIPDSTRSAMMRHIVQGHLNMLERGRWDLEKEIWGKK